MEKLKMKKRRILWLALLTAFVLSLSTAISEANETYNFYFQKAPGPTSVNQGTSPSAASVDPASGQAVPASGAPSATAPVLVAAATERPDHQRWYLGLGMIQIGNSHGVGLRDQSNGATVLEREAFSLSLEYALVDRLSLIAEGNLSAKKRAHPSSLYKGTGTDAHGEIETKAAYTFALSAAFDLFRSGSEKTAKFVLGPIGGVMSYRHLKYDGFDGIRFATTEGYKKETTPFFGARARLLMFDTLGVELQARSLLKPKELAYKAMFTYSL